MPIYLFRDSLTIDQNIAGVLAAAGVTAPPAETLVLGARQCTLAGLSPLFNYEIAAEKLIVTTPSFALLGTAANPSPEVTIAAIEIDGEFSLQSEAAPGARGKPGAPGDDGTPGPHGDPGDRGDKGGTGGEGSPGGKTIIHYCRASRPISADAVGGVGGPGGPGGPGGKGHPNGPPGPLGDRGPHGAPGKAEVLQVDIAQLWTTLDPESEYQWAHWRGVSFTIWNRLEVRSRADDLRPGLEARVFDPLWLLARQWQLGEFAGRDAGSPLAVAVTATTEPFDRYAAGSAGGEYYDGAVPLEVFVERETVRPASAAVDLRQAADAGMHFARLLEVATLGRLRPAYLAQYPLSGDGPGLGAVVTGRVINGIALHADVVAASAKLPAVPVLSDADSKLVAAVIQKWRAWYDGLFSEPSQPVPWLNERMEYSFAIGAGGDSGSFVAREYDGGTVDWHTFDRSPAILTGGSPQRSTATTYPLPSPIYFRGMPARRYWELEDASVDISALSAGPEDLGRLMLREFALIYGTDWFLVPVQIPVGSVVSIDLLDVTDTFGLHTAIPHYSSADGGAVPWRMFAVSADDKAAGSAPDYRLAILPTAAAILDGESFEDVLLLRDEMADMVWGVERSVLGPAGVSIDRTLLWKTTAPPAPPPNASGPPKYRLGSEVPDYWVQFLPVLVDSGTPGKQSLRFRRGKMPGPSSGPLGAFLSPAGLTLFPEEVPREGVRLDRRFRYVRGGDGSTYLWIGRERSTGLGEGSSGLWFDRLE